MDQFTPVESIIASMQPQSELAQDAASVAGLRLEVALNLLNQAGWVAPAAIQPG
ncbi:MAG: hypothetical protein IT506_00420, partial [Aquabacterium sp.]|nr:hypothetical protein [Aquabacterium sp.]